MNSMHKDEGKLLLTNTLAGALIGAAIGSVIGLLAGWSTVSIYDEHLAILVGSLLGFTVALGLIGAILGLFIDQDHGDRKTNAQVGEIFAQQAIPAPDWPRRTALLVNQTIEPSDRIEQ